MSEPQRRTLTYRLGDHVAITNDTPKDLRVKIVTACGTETFTTLQPGAEIDVTVGASAITVYLDVDESYSGPRLV